MRFVYTATGSEGSSFTIPFPTTRADANYVASVALSAQAMSWYSVRAPTSGYTTTGIAVLTGIAPTAGDTIVVVIMERTS